MHPDVDTSRLMPADVAGVDRLIAEAARARGYRPVSDQFWLDLHDGRNPPLLSVRVTDGHQDLLAYAQGHVTSGQWMIESVVHEDQPAAGSALSAAVEAALDGAVDLGGTDLVWLVQGPTGVHEAIADANTLHVDRRLHQMRRPLPTDLAFLIDTRAFDASRDVDPFVAVNARAFAWNTEQGSWTAESLRQRMSEPWFDPAGFLIHERDGRLAGFCWTKVHADTDPAIGEIYVIAVDPDFHGLGLGRELTLAGLDHLAGRGIRTGMLFVDADNVAAVRLYDRLGFTIHRTDSMFRKRLERT